MWKGEALHRCCYRLAMRVWVLAFVCLVGFSTTVKAVDGDACQDPELVSYTMKTPYTPEVAAIVPTVWIPHLLVPCPAIGWAIGQSQLEMPILDGRAQNIALLHSAFVVLCYFPLAFSVIGIPLLLIEQLYIAPVSILNALDRDVRCAKEGAAPRTTTKKPPPPPPPAANPRPLGDRPRLDPAPPPRREPLPPPPPSLPPSFQGTDPDGPRHMAW